MTSASYSEAFRCPHCSNYGRMRLIADGKHDLGYAENDLHGRETWIDGGENCYEITICQSCNKPVLRERHQYQYDENSYHRDPWAIIHPESRTLPKSVPARIVKALDEAERVRGVSANAYGVMSARALELICKHKGCSGKNLQESIEKLAAANEIPDRLATMAQHLRFFRNHGAHGDAIDLTAREVPVLRTILNAIVEYIYYAPTILEEAEKLVAQLTAKKTAKKAVD